MAVDIDVRVSGWEDDLERLDRRIDSIDGQTVDVDVDVDDAELDAAMAKAEALDDTSARLDVDAGDLSGLDDVEARIAALEQRSGEFETTHDETRRTTVTQSFDDEAAARIEARIDAVARDRRVGFDPDLDDADLSAIEARLDAAARDRSARVSIRERRTVVFDTEGSAPGSFDPTDETVEQTVRYTTDLDDVDREAVERALAALARSRSVAIDLDLDDTELAAIEARIDAATEDRSARVSVTRQTTYETVGDPPPPFDAADEAAVKTTRYRTVGDRPMPFDATDETKTVTFRADVDDEAVDEALATLTRNRDVDISPNVVASDLAAAEAALNRLARDRTAQINVEHSGVPTVSDGRGAGDGGRGGTGSGPGSGFLDEYLGLTPGEFDGRIRSDLPSDEFAERQFVQTGPDMGEGRQLGRDPETGDRVLRIEDDVAVRDIDLETREMRVIQTDPDVPASEMEWDIIDPEAAGATMAEAFGEDYEEIIEDARKQHVADARSASDMLRRRASFALSDTDLDFEHYLNTDILDADHGFAPGMRESPELDTSLGGRGGLGDLDLFRRDRDRSMLAGVADMAGDLARTLGSASAAMSSLGDASSDVLTSVGGLAKRSKSVLANMEGWYNLLAAMIPLMVAAGTQAVGIAAAFGGAGLAGLALLGGGLLGEGLTLEEATKNAKEDLKGLATDLFDVFQPTFAAFAPIQTQIFEQLPGDLRAVSQEMRDLTVYADLLSDGVAGFADWIAHGLDALERYEPMIDQLVRRFGALSAQAIGDALVWVIEEAYKRQDLLIAIAISFQQVGEMIYDLSIAVAQFVTAFNPLLHVLSIGVRVLSEVIGMFGPLIAGLIQAAIVVKAFAAAYSAAMTIAAASTLAGLWPVLALIAAIYALWELVGDAPDFGMGGGFDFGWGDKPQGDDLSGMLGMEASGPMRQDASPMGVGSGPGAMDRRQTPQQQSVTLNVYGQPSEETLQQMKDVARDTARADRAVDDVRERDDKGYSFAPDNSR